MYSLIAFFALIFTLAYSHLMNKISGALVFVQVKETIKFKFRRVRIRIIINNTI